MLAETNVSVLFHESLKLYDIREFSIGIPSFIHKVLRSWSDLKRSFIAWCTFAAADSFFIFLLSYFFYSWNFQKNILGLPGICDAVYVRDFLIYYLRILGLDNYSRNYFRIRITGDLQFEQWAVFFFAQLSIENPRSVA